MISYHWRIFWIFALVYAAMIAMAFWESYVEGRNPWDKRKVGWKFKIGKYYFTGYHFWLFWVMIPLFLSLPLVVYGWDIRTFGILLSAYLSGIVLEDFTWFVVNPVVKLFEFNSKWAKFYPWVKIGKIEIPLLYFIGLGLSILSWFFLWR